MCTDCDRLHEELGTQAHYMYLLQSDLTMTEKRLKREIHEKMKLVKEKKQDQKLRYKNRNRKSKHKEFYGYL